MPNLVETGRDGAVAILTLNQPARRNPLSRAMRAALLDAVERANGEDAVRAIVLTGAGGTFSSGGDLGDMNVETLAQGRARLIDAHRLVKAVMQATKPVIAAVEGWAAGAGLSLAVACDTVVAAQDARFVASFAKVGLIGDLGLLHTLPQRIGHGAARQMLLYAQPVAAAEALGLGLVDQLAAPGDALACAVRHAGLVCDLAPLPLAMHKAVLAAGLDAALERELELQSALYLSADHQEGKRAFLEKRKPVFRGA
ncbi:enoyl-CoA hydratase-related protein [Xanthobacter sp. DSM 24535]|uniref:enoyl-CoA hydratase/isomerase family protein n=1 Tax=Roseixanthobacter psychrophilus TaxID=3119917 RepID=UPI003729C94E